MSRKLKVRIAFREEGSFWNAYLALADTMKGAKLIGSISMGAVKQNQEIKDDFMAVMKKVMGMAITDVTGQAPEKWDTRRPPENEKSGHS